MKFLRRPSHHGNSQAKVLLLFGGCPLTKVGMPHMHVSQDGNGEFPVGGLLPIPVPVEEEISPSPSPSMPSGRASSPSPSPSGESIPTGSPSRAEVSESHLGRRHHCRSDRRAGVQCEHLCVQPATGGEAALSQIRSHLRGCDGVAATLCSCALLLWHSVAGVRRRCGLVEDDICEVGEKPDACECDVLELDGGAAEAMHVRERC
jgi:hypothetical protein